MFKTWNVATTLLFPDTIRTFWVFKYNILGISTHMNRTNWVFIRTFRVFDFSLSQQIGYFKIILLNKK